MYTQGLHAGTKVYFDQNSIYELFSQSEDFPGHILSYLISQVRNKEIIDFGCGTGKYTNMLAPYTKHIHALDASAQQVDYTKQCTQKHDNISYYTIADGKLPATNASCLIACRVLGTIEDKLRRSIVFNNMIKSVPKGCIIYFIENDIYGEFEEIRGKTKDILYPTISYNSRLEQQGCIPVKKIDTYFQFTSIQQATMIFKSIRGESVSKKITSAHIEHKVIIYKYVV